MSIILDGDVFPADSSKVVCVGRNYADHAKEMNSPIPEEPILFLKPASSLVKFDEHIIIPQSLGSVHHELEIALLIGQPLKKANPDEVLKSIVGIGLGLDLTLRDLQKSLKEKGQPWEKAKAFDGACPLSNFICPAHLDNIITAQEMTFSLTKNGKMQQQGNKADMIFSMVELTAYISQFFTLEKGDIILTGTPSGVGELCAGDTITAQLHINGQKQLTCSGVITH